MKRMAMRIYLLLARKKIVRKWSHWFEEDNVIFTPEIPDIKIDAGARIADNIRLPITTSSFID